MLPRHRSSSPPRSPTCCCCSRVAAWADRRARPGRSVIGNAWVYTLSIGVYCTAWTYFGSVGRAASVGRLVPADLPRADAGDAAGLDGAAQDDPHRAHPPHHLDRRLHRQPLRQEPRCWPALVTLIARGRHPALHRAAAEGDRQRLRAADRARRRPARPRPWWQRQHALHRAGAGRLHDRLRHAPPRHHRAPRGHGGGDRVRVGGQAAGVRRRRRVRHLGPVRRPGRHLRARAARSPNCARCSASAAARRASPAASGSR